MKILMLCYEFPPIGGGGGRVVAGLSRELVRQGHEVDVVTMAFERLPLEELVDGVRVHRVPCRRRRPHSCSAPEVLSYLLAVRPIILRLVRQRRFDLNHTHFILPDGFLARWVKQTTGIPYILTAHGTDVPGYNPERFQLAHRLLTPVWHDVVRGAAAVTCPSHILQASLLLARPGLDVPLIPNGFDEHRLRPAPHKKLQLLVVTRILKRKGIQYVLEALAGLPKSCEVHIVGDGPYLPTLRAMAKHHGVQVKFWGWLDNQSPELRELYETSSLYVLPSSAENFPVALLEAMSAGLAIITTRGTGCAEVVGEAGVLVEPKSAPSIRQALRRLIEDAGELRRLGQAARERLVANFSWPIVARQYLALYERVRR